jgi:hypothetical protein
MVSLLRVYRFQKGITMNQIERSVSVGPDLSAGSIDADTLVQFGSVVRRDLSANVMTHQSSSGCEKNFANLMASAERELGAFVAAVTDAFGAEEARRAAEDWLEELESMPLPDGLSSCLWRTITITSAARLTIRLNTAPTNTKVFPIRSSNCSLQEPLA